MQQQRVIVQNWYILLVLKYNGVYKINIKFVIQKIKLKNIITTEILGLCRQESLSFLILSIKTCV